MELNDQQVVTAVYLLTIGRSPTDSESKQVQMDFAETKNRPLSALQHAREMVQTREFNTGLANTSDRLYQIQSAIAAKRAAGEIPVLMAANDFQQFAADCATSVHQITKTDEQFVDLTFLLVLSRFPSESEASKLVPHLKNTPNRDTATKDIFVFLLNSQEFVDQR